MLDRIKRDVKHAIGDALRLFDAFVKLKVGARACFFEAGATVWLGGHVMMEPTGESKNWRKVARFVEWQDAIFGEALKDGALLDRAPLYFCDLTANVRRALDCVCDADDARVLPDHFPPRHAGERRRCDLAPQAYVDGTLTRSPSCGPRSTRSASRTRTCLLYTSPSPRD